MKVEENERSAAPGELTVRAANPADRCSRRPHKEERSDSSVAQVVARVRAFSQ